MENSQLVQPVKIQCSDVELGSLSKSLLLSEEDWDQLNTERKKVLDTFKDQFLEGAARGDKRPPFSKLDVIKKLQNTCSQQGLLILAAEQINEIFNEILQKSQAAMREDPMTMLLEMMMRNKPSNKDSKSETEDQEVEVINTTSNNSEEEEK